MSQNNNSAIALFRGKCEVLSQINDVGIDISTLVQSVQPAFDGEPGKKILPVRSQLTWFRLKNQQGNIVTEIVKHDEFMAIVSATVYTNDNTRISNAHGSADANADGIHGFKLVESAESRAIARALDFAGFGCQLDLKTFDEGSSGDADGVEKPLGNDDVQFPNEAPPVIQPGTPKGKQKVNANAKSGVIDISELEDTTSPSSEPKKGKGKKKAASEAIDTEKAPASTPSMAADDSVVDEVTDLSDAPAELKAQIIENAATLDECDVEKTSTDSAQEPVEAAADEATEETATGDTEPSETAQEDAQTVVGDNSPTEVNTEGAFNSELYANKAEQLVMESIAMTIGNDLPKPALDTRFFPTGASYEDAVINGKGAQTEMNNLELQLAITFLETHTKLIGKQLYPCSPKAQNYGKTFDDIASDLSDGRSELDSKANAEAAAKTCVDLYRKNKVSVYAAALLLNAKAIEKEGGDK